MNKYHNARLPLYDSVESPVEGQIAVAPTCGTTKLLVFRDEKWALVENSTKITLNGCPFPCLDVVDHFILKDKVIPSNDTKVSMSMVGYIAFHSDPGTIFTHRLSDSDEERVCVSGEGTEFLTFALNQEENSNG